MVATRMYRWKLEPTGQKILCVPHRISRIDIYALMDSTHRWYELEFKTGTRCPPQKTKAFSTRNGKEYSAPPPIIQSRFFFNIFLLSDYRQWIRPKEQDRVDSLNSYSGMFAPQAKGRYICEVSLITVQPTDTQLHGTD